MESMVGTRMFLFYTGAELSTVLPITFLTGHSEGLYSLRGEVTRETAGGVWFQPEQMFNTKNDVMQVNFSDNPEYFLPWAALRRALLAKTEKKTEKPPEPLGVPEPMGFQPPGALGPEGQRRSPPRPGRRPRGGHR